MSARISVQQHCDDKTSLNLTIFENRIHPKRKDFPSVLNASKHDK